MYNYDNFVMGIMKKDHHYSDIIFITPIQGNQSAIEHLGEIVLFIFEIITWAILPILLFRATVFD